MTKKYSIGLVSIAAWLVVAVSVFSSGSGQNAGERIISNAYNEYTTTLNSLNRISGGKIKTDSGNDISISFNGLSTGEYGWHIIAPNGSFSNTDPINGVFSIAYSGDGDLSISYGFNGISFTHEDETLSNEVTFYPTGYPSYFEINNTSENPITINSIVFSYSCVGGVSPEAEIIRSGDYSYVDIDNNEIKLIKYHGETLSFIEIPTEIDNKSVKSIASGCFKTPVNRSKRVLAKSIENEPEVDNEQSEYSTYFIDDSIDEVEENAFDEKSSFITNANSKKANWRDSSLNGSAIDEKGNVYYSTNISEVVTKGGINYVYSPNLRGYYLARCLTQRKTVEIPSEINGYSVIDIGSMAFYANSHIQKVVLPSTIANIYGYAFYECTSLREVVFDCPTLNKIRQYAFSGCTSLLRIVLPPNLTTIFSYAFSDNGEIEEVYLPGSLNSLGDEAFRNTTVKRFYYAATEELFNANVINDNNRHIFEGAEIIFEMTNQDYVELNSLEEIVDVANNSLVRCQGVICGYDNYNSRGYRNLMIMNPDTNYVMNCFNNNGLGFDNIEYIGLTVEVSGTKQIYVGDIELTGITVSFLNEEKINLEPINIDYQDENFDPYDYLDKYCVIEATVLSIYKGTIYFDGIPSMFGYCTYHSYAYPGPIYVGEDVIIRGWVVMYNQTIELKFDIRTVSFPSRTDAGDYSYNPNNNMLTNVSQSYVGEFVIPNNITAIGDYAFRDCTSITSIVIPNSVTSIGNEAFYGCSSLTSVTIPTSVTSISSTAFPIHNSIEHLYFKINSISEYLSWERPYIYSGYVHLIDSNGNEITDIVIPDDTLFIDSHFEDCAFIETIKIPNGIFCSYSSFSGCDSLQAIYFIVDSFSDFHGLENDFPCDCHLLDSEGNEIIDIPACTSLSCINECTFGNCVSINSIILTDSIVDIYFYGLDGCTSLTNIYYLGDAESWETIYKEEYSEEYANMVSFYSEMEPVGEGSYWHYVNDTPTLW